MSMENGPNIEEVKSEHYIINVFSERTGSPIYKVNDASIEELRDIVIHQHKALENILSLQERALAESQKALGYDPL